MATDALVKDLLDSMHSFTEDAVCPCCEGHGAVSQGKRDIIIDMMPKPLPENITVSPEYNPNLKAMVMKFTVSGAFVAKDLVLAREKWDEVEGELRKEFEKFLTELNKGWQASNALHRIKKAEQEAAELEKKKKPRPDAAPLNQITPEETAKKMKEQEAALLNYMKQHNIKYPEPQQKQMLEAMKNAQQVADFEKAAILQHQYQQMSYQQQELINHQYQQYLGMQGTGAMGLAQQDIPLPPSQQAVAEAVAKETGDGLMSTLKGILGKK